MHSTFVRTLLLHKYCGITNDSHLQVLVTQAAGGFKALLQLAQHAQHPRLVDAIDQDFPRQEYEEALLTYLPRCVVHAKLQYLNGFQYSQRFFYEQVYKGMNRQLERALPGGFYLSLIHI